MLVVCIPYQEIWNEAKNPNWTIGAGGDLALGLEGFGGSFGLNNASISGSTSIPLMGYGIGASAGAECCVGW